MKKHLAVTAAFLLSGLYCTGQTPEINVTGNGVTIVDGDLTPSGSDHTNFGSLLVCTGTVVRTFTIQNQGTGDLNIGTVNISGADAADYTVIALPLSSVAAGNSTAFQVRYDPSTVGFQNAMITINNDDADESAYNFAINGNGYADVVNPTANCRNLSLYLNASGTASIIPVMLDNGSTDNCGIASMSVSQTSFTCANIGSNNVTLTVTDGSGNSSMCTGIVTVLDSVRPVANCRNLSLYLNASGTANVIPAMLNNGSTDNCGIASMSVSQTSFTCANIGSNNVTLTVTDGSGNSSMCTGIVTVLDSVRPVANCRNLSLYLNASGTASIIPVMLDNGSTDNCGIASMSVSQTSFTCANIGSNNVTLTVTDGSGNSSMCTGIVTVLDSVRPVANCRNLSLHLNASGTASVIPAMLNNGSTDNCGIASMSVSQTSFTCANIGSNNVTLTVTDGSGNSSSCTSVITVIDTVRPVAICNDTTLYISASGNLVITPAALNLGSSDACGIASMSVSPNTFSCSQVAVDEPVTLTVTDVNGNSRTCVSLVDIFDGLPPVAICRNVTVYLDASGIAGISPAMINNGSYDECGIVAMNVTPNTFTCSNTGTNNVTFTVFDSFGQNSSCTAVVTVLDTIRPVANCRNIPVVLNASGTASITGAMIDNGSTDVCGIASMTVSPGSFNCSNIGPNNVVLTVTDNNGNSSSCNAIVTVSSGLSATINVNNHVSCSGGSDAQATAVPSGGTGPFSYAWLPAGGTGATAGALAAGTYTCTISDNNGCSATQTISITQPLPLTLTAASLSNVNCNGAANGSASVNTATGGAGGYIYDWAPGNPAGDGTASVTGLAAGTWTCTVTDANSCTATQTFNITQPSALVAGSSATSVLCNGGNATITVTETGGTAPYSGDGAFTVTAGTYSYTVTDANGCTSTTTITVTEPAALAASSSATSVLCNGGNATITVTETGGTAPYSGDGAFTVTAGTYSYTVTDANGCTSTTTITLTEPAALAASSSATSVLCNGGNATITVTETGGTAPYSGDGTFTVTAGTYSYTVTDANGCTSTTTITVTEPAVLAASSSATAVLCNGGNATITVTETGGTAPYSGDGTFTVTAGTYSYTVTDANGCTSTTTITVTEPAVLSASSSASAILCNGGNATITVTETGGTAPYSGDGTFTVTAGTYSYTVTDANGCTSTTTITITEPSVLSASSSATAVLCNGDSADITVVGAGGTSPYTGEGTFTVTAGTYSYTVTDANGCTSTTSITITEPAAISTSVTSVNVSCNGGSDGSIDLTVTGGTGPFTFSWNNGAFTTEDLTGLPAGTYSGILTDANGCIDSGTVVISEPLLLAASVAAAANPTTCAGTDGSIDISITGGTAGYTYLWSTTATTEDISGLGAGVYSCTITDANGCTTTTSATLNDPNAPSVTLSVVQDTVCLADAALTLGGEFPSGGTWSGNGVTGNMFDPAVAGLGAHLVTYTYTDTNSCTGSATDSILVDICTNVVTVSAAAPAFTVFPNPNNGTFTLQQNASTVAEVLIYDAQGKLVSAQQVQPGTQQTLTIADPGIYMITVIAAGGQRSSRRVVVSK